MYRQGRTTSRIRGTTPASEAAARHMRQNPTPAEEALWQALKGRQLHGLKFRRQHPVGLSVLDFYCPACQLVVEVDGEGHEEQRDHDEARSQQLGDHDYRVLRFRNDEVMNHLNAVLEQIWQAATSVQTLSCSCTPHAGDKPPCA